MEKLKYELSVSIKYASDPRDSFKVRLENIVNGGFFGNNHHFKKFLEK